MSGLSVSGVTAGYGGPPVIHGIDLAADRGELLSIVGPSGCGKTTLVRTVAGFLRPSTGTIRIDGGLVSGPGVFIPPERRRVGIVPQDGALFPHLDVAGNIAFGIPRAGLADGRTAAVRVAELLELVGLVGLNRVAPHELSGGQQQRVALARALAPDPEVMLLDEPFSALDANLRVDLRSEVREVLRAVGTTTILVTHDQEEALAVSDRVALMITGRIIQSGSPMELYSAPVNLDVARFLGESVELPTSRVVRGSAATPLGEVPVTETSLTSGVVVLRPEQFRCSRGDEVPLVVGTVTDVQYHGHDSLITLTTASGFPLRVRLMGQQACRVGDPIRLSVDQVGTVLPHGA